MGHAALLWGHQDILRLIREHAEVIECRYAAASPGGNAIVAVRTTGFLSGPELRRYCHERGAPAYFDVLVTDGELDTDCSPAELRSLAGSAPPGAYSKFAAPEGAVEAQLTEIWARLLEFAPVGVLDDFVDLGGDSLIALEITVEVFRHWGRDLSLVDLADASYIRNLAQMITAPAASAAEE